MVARCRCGLIWNISIKAQIPKDGYKCPICRDKQRRKNEEEASKEKKLNDLRKGRVSNVLIRNRKKFQL